MAKYSIKDTTLTALGDAIRDKTGKKFREEEALLEPYKIYTDTRIEDFSKWNNNGTNNYSREFEFEQLYGEKAYKFVFTHNYTGRIPASVEVDFINEYGSGSGFSNIYLEMSSSNKGQVMERIVNIPTDAVKMVMYERIYPAVFDDNYGSGYSVVDLKTSPFFNMQEGNFGSFTAFG